MNGRRVYDPGHAALPAPRWQLQALAFATLAALMVALMIVGLAAFVGVVAIAVKVATVIGWLP